MLWFNDEKGFGFIETDEGERLYVDRNGFEPGHCPVGRCSRKLVAFERAPADVEGGEQAVRVTMVDEVPARRARMHGRS